VVIDDRPIVSPVCILCKHWHIDDPKKTCDAFPDNIPDEIWMGENNHRKPFPGDRGIQFELIDEAKILKF
jgi:hypothetical protein